MSKSDASSESSFESRRELDGSWPTIDPGLFDSSPGIVRFTGEGLGESSSRKGFLEVAILVAIGELAMVTACRPLSGGLPFDTVRSNSSVSGHGFEIAAKE